MKESTTAFPVQEEAGSGWWMEIQERARSEQYKSYWVRKRICVSSDWQILERPSTAKAREAWENHSFLQSPASTLLLFSLLFESKFLFVHWERVWWKHAACDACLWALSERQNELYNKEINPVSFIVTCRDCGRSYAQLRSVILPQYHGSRKVTPLLTGIEMNSSVYCKLLPD